MHPSKLEKILTDHVTWLSWCFSMRAASSGGISYAHDIGRRASFYNECLAGADLRDRVLRHAYMHGVDLKGANLTGAALEGVDLTNADLRGAKFTVEMLDVAQFSGALITRSQLAWFTAHTKFGTQGPSLRIYDVPRVRPKSARKQRKSARDRATQLDRQRMLATLSEKFRV